MATKLKPGATIIVSLQDDTEVTHTLVSDKDWAVIFDDVLEVKDAAGATYYPLLSVQKWVVK